MWLNVAGGVGKSAPAMDTAPAQYRGFTPRDAALVALFAALIAVMSVMPGIPLAGLGAPLTLQTLGVMLAPAILGAKRGALAVLAFLALALAGLPLMAGGTPGLPALLGPSGGFIVSWPLVAWVIGFVTDRMRPGYRVSFGITANVLGGMLLCYAVGLPWMIAVTGSEVLGTVLAFGLYLPGDLVKAVIAAVIASGVHRAWRVPPPGRRVFAEEAAQAQPAS